MIIGSAKILTKRLHSRLYQKFDSFVSASGFHRMYHIHIRKCAGTSMNKALIMAAGGDTKTYDRLAKKPFHRVNLKRGPVVGWNETLINSGSFFYGFSHIPYHRLRLDEHTFTFTFLRNPKERIISHYTMLQDMIVNRSKNPALKQEADWAFGSFEDFLKKVPRFHLENQLYMFSESFSVEEAIENLSQVKLVCKVEDTSLHFIPKLESEFELNIEYNHLRASKTSVILSDALESRLDELIADEMSFYRKAVNLGS